MAGRGRSRKEVFDAQGNKLKWCTFGKHYARADLEHFKESGGYNDGWYPICRACTKRRNNGEKPTPALKVAGRKQWQNAQAVLEWYNKLSSVDKLAMNAYLNEGDTRLLKHVAPRIFNPEKKGRRPA